MLATGKCFQLKERRPAIHGPAIHGPPIHAALLLLLASTCLGCRPAAPATDAVELRADASGFHQPVLVRPQRTARELMDRMLASYRNASFYRDRAAARLSYEQEGRPFTDEAPLSVSFRRSPSQLDVKAYQTRLTVADGELQAIVMDPATRNLDGQVLARPLAGPLALPTLLDDDVLFEAVNSGLCRVPPQLDLLLSPTPWSSILREGAQLSKLPVEDLGDGPCERVQITNGESVFVAWIRQSDFVLRRLEYPASVASGVAGMQLVADFRDASFRADDPSVFQWPPPQQATLVERFVPPPRGLPHPLYGQVTPPFTLQSADGAAVHRDDLFGRPSVLVWFRRHEACLGALQQIEPLCAASQAGVAPAVNFAAIAVEPHEVSNDELSRVLGQARISMPLMRDPQTTGRDVFEISLLPAIVVLDQQGRMQALHQGNQPQLGRVVADALAAIQQGDNVAETLVARIRQEQAAYVEDLRAAGADLPAASLHLPSATKPKRLNLQRVWSVSDVMAPGNLTTSEGVLYAMSGARSVAVLDSSGRLLDTISLPLPAGAAVTRLRVVHHRGDRQACFWSTMGPAVFAMDEQWRLSEVYPPLSATEDLSDLTRRVRDVELADLDQDGRHEIYVAFDADEGVHRVDSGAGRQWVNRACPEPMTLTHSVNDGAALLWAVSRNGDAYPFTAEGDDLPPRHPYSRALIDLHRASPEIEATVHGFCGVTLNSLGQPVALGLDAQFGEVWNYDLPAGSFATQLQYVASGSLWPEDPGHWIFAGPDGSIHLVGLDGRSHDHFFLGHSISGLTLLSGERPMLIVASDKAVSAWRIEP